MTNSRPTQTISWLGVFFSISFMVFIVWIVHEANVGRDNLFFTTIRRVPNGDKVGHFLLAGFLTLSANHILKLKLLRFGKFRIPLGSLIVLVLVIGEESSQYFLPLRTLDIWDAAANFSGIFVATTINMKLRDRRTRGLFVHNGNNCGNEQDRP